MLKTAEALKAKGCHVDITTELEPDLSAYEIVHIFNLSRPQDIYLQAVNAKKQGKKIALSTIYGSSFDYDRQARLGLAGLIIRALPYSKVAYLKVGARALLNREFHKGTIYVLLKGYYSLKKRVAEMADIFLPNSESEMKRVLSDHNLKNPKYVVVPNAVDEKVFSLGNVAESEEVKKFKGSVLSVARIEGHKCQLELVKAFEGLPYKLIIIGKPSPNHRKYYDMVKKEAGENVHFIGHLDHDLLAQFYKVAKVHCLISWLETPGLSSLEAGVMGCNLVITEKGDTRDYFGDYAHYCDPDSIESIRDAVIKAYEAPVDNGLRQRILKNYICMLSN